MITTQIADTPEKIAFDLPKAVGVVRYDLSESNADRHTVAIRRHAETLGYDYLYTVVRHEALFSGSEVRGL
ncbi:hypothetical protein KO481_38755 [Nocardia sp. NEAU-G5]|uniref:Uncharacterized protein n=1 Tax=Nocardia albiluteola TaxID=2842303 RepID=A0ABS6BD94_9NOCA|nr:hypothetical protein [Nocardia albiluteola]MBU3067451.1 hypothetical protein [Nocardia albiluteola]